MTTKSVQINGTKVAYAIHKNKNKPWLMFIHGWGSNHSIWDPYVEHFKKRYSILTPDLRGHGLSADGKIDFKEIADDINAIIEKEQIKDAHIIGHSMGALVAAEVHKKGKVKSESLTLITPFTGRYTFARPLAKQLFKGSFAAWEGPKERKFQRYWEGSKPKRFTLPLDLHGTSKKTLVDAFEAMQNYIIEWENLKGNIQVLQGTYDPLVWNQRLKHDTKKHKIKTTFVPAHHLITAKPHHIIKHLEVFFG